MLSSGTNFRPYEAAILHAVNSVKAQISVIWCDTGYNTPQTYKHAEQVIKDLDLNVFFCSSCVWIRVNLESLLSAVHAHTP